MKREIIERLYEVFAAYRDERKVMHNSRVSAPLHLMTPDDLDKIGYEEDSTGLFLVDIRHFLPRIIELKYGCIFFCDGCRPFGLEASLGASKWKSWPVAEVEALRAV